MRLFDFSLKNNSLWDSRRGFWNNIGNLGANVVGGIGGGVAGFFAGGPLGAAAGAAGFTLPSAIVVRRAAATSLRGGAGAVASRAHHPARPVHPGPTPHPARRRPNAVRTPGTVHVRGHVLVTRCWAFCIKYRLSA